jgi:CRP-like cAMP-binding protein
MVNFKDEPNTQHFLAGEMIFDKGDYSQNIMYGIIEGEVEIFVEDQKIDHLRAQDILGEMALVDDAPRSGRAVAKTNCQLAVIDKKRFMFMIQNTPFFALEVMEVMANRIRRLMYQGIEP